jgi:hypothetical protein
MLRRPQRVPRRRWGRFCLHTSQAVMRFAKEPPRRSKLRRPVYRLRRAYVHGGLDSIDPDQGWPTPWGGPIRLRGWARI